MYCTQTDIEERFGLMELVQLTDRTRSGLVDATAVARAITDAAAEIDGYLAGRYSLPFEASPSVLARLACDIAIYNLFAARRNGGVFEDVRNRYRDAVRLLENIANGKVTLGTTVISNLPKYTYS